jgi:hypothetical protein
MKSKVYVLTNLSQTEEFSTFNPKMVKNAKFITTQEKMPRLSNSKRRGKLKNTYVTDY